MFEQMQRAGVRLAEFHPIRPWDCTFGWRPFNRDHRKLLVIDDDIAGIGGLNVGARIRRLVGRPDRKPPPAISGATTRSASSAPRPDSHSCAFANTWHYVHTRRAHRHAPELIPSPRRRRFRPARIRPHRPQPAAKTACELPPRTPPTRASNSPWPTSPRPMISLKSSAAPRAAA